MSLVREGRAITVAIGVVLGTAVAYPVLASEPVQLQAGVAVQVAPRYEGSQDFRIIGIPVVMPGRMGDDDRRFQFKGLDHLQYALVSTNGFQFGPLVGYRTGRDQDEGRRLHGLGDIDGGVVAGGFAAYRFGALRASLSYHHQLSGDDTGGVLKAGIDGRHDVSKIWRLTGGVGVTWADDDYMQSFFGVTAAQALTSGHRAFSAEAGLKDVNLSLGSELQLAPQWMLRLNGRYARLVGDAGDSPVIDTRDQWSGGAAITYSFTIPR
ncbi:MAG: MipA/OmpV family protein [Hyphomicrobiaceae bacterium]